MRVTRIIPTSSLLMTACNMEYIHRFYNEHKPKYEYHNDSDDIYNWCSHEKKKMYWEQLEHRRRLLYRRAPTAAAAANACSCCDDYGFVPPSELYPWAPWDTLDDRWDTWFHSFTGNSNKAGHYITEMFSLVAYTYCIYPQVLHQIVYLHEKRSY